MNVDKNPTRKKKVFSQFFLREYDVEFVPEKHNLNMFRLNMWKSEYKLNV